MSNKKIGVNLHIIYEQLQNQHTMSIAVTEAKIIQNDLRQHKADLELVRAERFESWANAITGKSKLALEAKVSYLQLALECRIAANIILSSSNI